MSFTEIKIKNLDDLIKKVDSKKTKGILVLNGNSIDAFALIERYSLEQSELDPGNNYKLFKRFASCEKNKFIISPRSVYGHIIIHMNINGTQVRVCQNPRSDYESRYVSNAVKTYQNQNFVVLDIETTGLNPLTDDIIQICIYESNKNYWTRFLPLRKKQVNTAKEINKISEKTLKVQEPLTQTEIDEVIKQFNLNEKIIMIWSPKNWFDRIFLEVYFKENRLTGLDSFTFFNAINLLSEFKNELHTENLSLDNIASLYGIDCHNSHNALSDCKIEKEIICNLINKSISTLISSPEENIYAEIINFYDKLQEKMSNLNFKKHYLTDFDVREELIALRRYNAFCDFLRYKYKKVSNDYDKGCKTRGYEWIDIHHIDETEIDNIAVRTQIAQKENNEKELKKLAKYNKRERLVYANKVEHFILHALLEMYRCSMGFCSSGGLHFTFGDIVRLEIGIFDNNPQLANLQNQKQKFYKYIPFEKIVDIYTTTCIMFGISDIQDYIKNYWKIDEYKYDTQKYKSIINLINENFKNN